MSAERFLIRTDGGPCDGETRVANSSGRGEFTWPLPFFLKYGDDGYYRKYSESGLAGPGIPAGVLRGAQYSWVEFGTYCKCLCTGCDCARLEAGGGEHCHAGSCR